MSYRYPADPRPKWEWCPKCEAWYEIRMDEFYRRPFIATAGQCSHDEAERRLTEQEVELASRPAADILRAFASPVWSETQICA